MQVKSVGEPAREPSGPCGDHPDFVLKLGLLVFGAMSGKGKGKLPEVVMKCDELMLQPMDIWHFSSPAVNFGGEKTVIVIEEDSSNMNQSWIELLQQSALDECIDNYLYEENKIRDEVCEHGVPEVR